MMLFNTAGHQRATNIPFKASYVADKAKIVKQEQLTAYQNASLLGRSPLTGKVTSFNGVSLNYTPLSKKAKNQFKAQKYQQQAVDYLYINAQDIGVALSYAVPAFTKESHLDSGLVVNFMAG
jgi:hypothetical protein